MPTKQRDRLAAGLLMVFAAAVFASTYSFPEPAQPLDPGPAAMPRIAAAVIFVLAILPLVRPQEGEKLPRGAGLIRVGATIVLLLGYALTIDVLGFVFSTIAFLVLELLLIGVRSWPALVVMPLATSFGLFYLFREALDVPLPTSGLGGLPF